MKDTRVKAQALALVLIVVVIAIIVAVAITTRVVQDIRQTGQEKASTRAETVAQSAVEDLSKMIEDGTLASQCDTQECDYVVGKQPASGGGNPTAAGYLGLCDTTSTDPQTSCDIKSTASVQKFNKIIQMRLNNNESTEVNLASTTSQTKYTDADSQAIIHILSNNTYDASKSKLSVKAFARTSSGLVLIGECMWPLNSFNDTSAGATTNYCLPYDFFAASGLAQCPTVKITSTTSKQLGDACLQLTTKQYGSTFYRVKPILVAATGASGTPYVDFSATGADPNAGIGYDLKVPQMALLRAGVYSANSGDAQQIYQQYTMIKLLNKSVPEEFDYVIFNGSNQPIVKPVGH